MRQRRGRWAVAGVFLLVVLAGAYLFGVNPILDHITQGLDLQGGLYVVFQAQPGPNSPVTPTTMQTAVAVMRYRVDALGVAEPQIQQEGSNRIVVQLPGVKNADQALQTIGQTGLLEFKDSKGNVIVTGKDLVSARAAIGTQGPEVQVQFDSSGAKKIAAFTEKNVGNTMPIYLDKKQISDPVIQQAIPSGNGVINNIGTLKQAQALAVELSSGALPVSLQVVQNNTVSATLGADSIRRSKAAALIAIILVVAFMLTIYRIPGFWADFALAVYAMLLLMVLAAVNATLTLPGITGLILSVGMAVDSNVIIYERIKEELRAGRSLRSAVDEGFRNGLRAVYDSNATTVIASAVLFWLGTGPIRGFALTVGVGVLISLLTAVTFTKYLLHRLIDSGAQPGVWFFARRGELAVAGATAGAGGGGPVASAPAPARSAPSPRRSPSRSGFSFRAVATTGTATTSTDDAETGAGGAPGDEAPETAPATAVGPPGGTLASDPGAGAAATASEQAGGDRSAGASAGRGGSGRAGGSKSRSRRKRSRGGGGGKSRSKGGRS